MEKIRKIEIDGEKIFLKKQKFTGWNVVYPTKNEDGSNNWFNTLCGNRRGLIQILVILVISLLVFGAWIETTASCRDMAKHPGRYFTTTDIVATEIPGNFTITDPLKVIG